MKYCNKAIPCNPLLEADFIVINATDKLGRVCLYSLLNICVYIYFFSR